ncbi:MAG: ComEC family competence protein [Alphaproteobacteria bacterium]|nr:ComEC family competence protein [Alphaproteobacteria bacterium]
MKRLYSSFYNDFDRWPLWAPVFLGLGIIVYFSLSFEPPLLWALGCCLFFSLSCLAFGFHPLRLGVFCIGLIALGFSAAYVRTHLLNTSMLHYPLPPLILQGKINQVELKPTLKGTFTQRVILTDLKAETVENLPSKIRLTIKGKMIHLWPGQIIRLKVKMTPLSDPSLPGGFDFRRQAYFQGIGATGFSFSSPEIVGFESSWKGNIEKRREEVTDFFLSHFPSPQGAIAAALITGDKAGIPEATREDFINSGLAHILAISGLHLTIIAGVVFMIIRRGIALIPPLCLRYNSKKIAALGTILMTFIYLILSGFGIPAQRAFIMIFLVMGAILMDRTALSMRTVAFAAFLILLFKPEALLGPSFQLSFAAVVALISGYETWKNPLVLWLAKGGTLRKFLIYGGGLVFTSLLATLATLPFTIYLFHRFSLHAIEANLIAVPLTSLVIMPSALLSCLMAPLGLGDTPLWVFEKSIELLIFIAANVSTWPGANIGMPHPPYLSLILIIFGGMWLCLWQQTFRKWGFLFISLGVLMIFEGNPPQLLIDGQGKVAALYENDVLYVSSHRKGKFTVDTWKKYLSAKEIKTMTCEEGVCKVVYRDTSIVISSKKENQPCFKDAILIRLEPNLKACPEARLTLDWYNLWRGGSHAIWITPQRYDLRKAKDIQGNRPWTRRIIPRRERPTKTTPS